MNKLNVVIIEDEIPAARLLDVYKRQVLKASKYEASHKIRFLLGSL